MIDLNIRGIVIRDIKLIIFDKDGTLFQLYPFWSELAKKRAQILAAMVGTSDPSLQYDLVRRMGVDLPNRSMFPDGPIGIYPRNHIVNTVQAVLAEHGHPIDLKTIEEAFNEADTYASDPNFLRRTMVPVKGAFEFLKNLGDDCICAILSSDRTARLEMVTSIFEITSCFKMLVGGDQTKFSKPNAWGAHHIMEELGVGPENTLFVGDSISDIECGCNSGCAHKIAIISDITDRSRIQQCQGLLVHDFTEIKIIRK